MYTTGLRHTQRPVISNHNKVFFDPQKHTAFVQKVVSNHHYRMASELFTGGETYFSENAFFICVAACDHTILLPKIVNYEFSSKTFYIIYDTISLFL